MADSIEKRVEQEIPVFGEEALTSWASSKMFGAKKMSDQQIQSVMDKFDATLRKLGDEM